MDKFTRVYSVVLLVVGLAVLFVLFFERPIVSDLNSAAFLEAKQQVARMQGKAKQLVMEHDDITSISWVLDAKWLRNNDVNPDLLNTTSRNTQ